MKRILSLALLAVLAAVLLIGIPSCKKTDEPTDGSEDPVAPYGVDGVTPMPRAVDIGIVVDGKTVLWSSFNLGASKEYEYGDFLAWGETTKKTEYGWANYKYAKGSSTQLTRYCNNLDYWATSAGTMDKETKLLPSDDAAQVRLGGKWRMPEKEELEALLATLSNAQYSWSVEMPLDEKGNEIKDSEGNTVRGWRVVSNKPGTKGNSIFFPFTGYFTYDDFLLYSHKGAGSRTGFLSTLLDSENPSRAFGIGMLNKQENIVSGSQPRADGLPVRPVCSK